MRRAARLAASFAAVAASAAVAGGEPPTTAYRVLVPGFYRAGEVPPGLEGEWGAVCGAGTTARLETARVAVVALFDEVFDESPAARSGRRVELAGCSDLAFLVRGLPGAPRPLPASPAAQDAGDARATSFGDAPLRVRKESGPEGWSLVLEWKERKQPLFVARRGAAGTWDVPWVGDLDADGSPDLLLQAAESDGARALRLFLSSEAGEAALVREVAVFRTALR